MVEDNKIKINEDEVSNLICEELNVKKNIFKRILTLFVKIIFVLDYFDDLLIGSSNVFFDKLLDFYDSLFLKDNPSDNFNNIDDDKMEIRAINKPIIDFNIEHPRSINFEDLEPLCKNLDEEDYIYEIKKLEIESLFNEENRNLKKKILVRKK